MTALTPKRALVVPPLRIHRVEPRNRVTVLEPRGARGAPVVRRRSGSVLPGPRWVVSQRRSVFRPVAAEPHPAGLRGATKADGRPTGRVPPATRHLPRPRRPAPAPSPGQLTAALRRHPDAARGGRIVELPPPRPRGGKRHPGFRRHYRHNRWFVYWHPWFGYTWYFPAGWWNPWYCAYFPSYYFAWHYRRFSFWFGLGLPWCGWRWWWYPVWYRECYAYYPYYVTVLTYPYVRYVSVGSGPTYDPYGVGYDPDLAASPQAAEPGAAPAPEAEPLPESGPPPRVLTLAEYYLQLGDQAFREGRYEDALEAYRQAVTADPEAGAPRFALAEALFALGRYQEAAFQVRQGLRRAPDFPESDHDRRRLYPDEKTRRSLEEKLVAYRKAHPYDPAAAFLLGYLRYFAGDLEGARAAFEALLELLPEDPDAERFLKVIADRAEKSVSAGGETVRRG